MHLKGVHCDSAGSHTESYNMHNERNTPEIMEQCSASHSDDDVSCGTVSALVVHYGAHSLVGVVVTPECKINVVFLKDILLL